MKNLFSVSGKVAVVTGGSSGLGAMMAQGLLANGAKVYIAARKLERLHATAEALSQYGKCIAVPADVSNAEGIESLRDAISEREDSIDILVNNAGANWVAPIGGFPEKAWDKVMATNVKSVFFATQSFIPLLKAAGSAEDPARVINIASIHGIRNPGMPAYAYSASKSGIIHLTTHLSAELASSHINVNAIAPGLFPSEMTKQIVQNEGILSQAIKQIPRCRIGEPEDIAGTAIFLSSRASAWITGETIALDGGMISTA